MSLIYSKSCKENVLVFFLFLIIAFIFETVFSSSTSWLYDKPVLWDSGFFQIIGKYWALGEALPYRDLWDSKGPIIFVVNALGYLLTSTKIGVSVIQMLFLSVSLVIAFKLLLTSYTRVQSFFIVCLIPVSLAVMVNDGNGVTEYALPLTMLSYILIYRSLTARNLYFPWKYALVYGLTFGWCLMSRITDFAGVGGALLGLMLLFITKKRWHDFAVNALAFVLGSLVVILPFVIYFGIHGSEYEMWYGTFIYNIQYANVASEGHNSLFYIVVFVKNYLPLLLMFLLSILLVVRKNCRVRGLVWLFSSGISLLWFSMGLKDGHYAPVILPYICLFFLELRNIISIDISTKRIFRMSFPVVLIMLSFGFAKEISDAYNCYHGTNTMWENDKKLIDIVPQKDRNAYCQYDWAQQNYIYADIKPCYPYFSLQEHAVRYNRNLRYRILNAFSSRKAKWILVSDRQHALIKPILDKYYKVVAKNGAKELMVRK